MEKLKVITTKSGKSFFTTEAIQIGETIMELGGKILSSPTRTSIQVDENKHLENVHKFGGFLNHSCEPNTCIDFDQLRLRAIKPIGKNEEATFNYLTTEWDLINKFKCNCSSKDCCKNVNGFKYLTSKQQNQLLPLISPFLKKKLEILNSI